MLNWGIKRSFAFSLTEKKKKAAQAFPTCFHFSIFLKTANTIVRFVIAQGSREREKRGAELVLTGQSGFFIVLKHLTTTSTCMIWKNSFELVLMLVLVVFLFFGNKFLRVSWKVVFFMESWQNIIAALARSTVHGRLWNAFHDAQWEDNRMVLFGGWYLYFFYCSSTMNA